MFECEWLIYIFSLILGASGAQLVADYGNCLGLVDLPTARSSHVNPTPKGGAVGVVAAFIVFAVVLKISGLFWFPCVVLAMVSLLGDRRDISPRIRLAVQFGAVFFVLCGFVMVDGMVLLGELSLQTIPLFLFFSVFIVGTANFYNFMDGINGIAAITGVVGFGLLAGFAYSRGNQMASGLSLGLLFACLGFLPFNIPSAKVFMGDVGSILLGFVFACLVTLLSESWLDFMCLAACLFPFYADEISTMAFRIMDRESLGRPHRRHLYQLLANELRIPHWKISIGYGLLQLLMGVSVLYVTNIGRGVLLLLLSVYVVCFSLFSVVVRHKVAAIDVNLI